MYRPRKSRFWAIWLPQGLLALTLILGSISTGWVDWLFDIAGRNSAHQSPVGHDTQEAALRLGCLIAAAAAFLSIFLRLRSLAVHAAIDDDPIFDSVASQRSATDLQSLAEDSLRLADPQHLAVISSFVEMAVSPVRSRTHISESFELAGPVATHTVTMTIRFPSKFNGDDRAGADDVKIPQFLYVPLVQSLTRTTATFGQIRDGSGKAVVCLSPRESLRQAAIGLRLLIVSALQSSEEASRLDETQRGVELALFWLIANQRSDSGNDDSDVAGRRMQARANLLLDKLGLPTHDENRRRLERYVTNLAMSDLTVAVVPTANLVDGHVILSYSASFVNLLYIRGIIGGLRMAMGLQPPAIRLPITLALTASSYRLEVSGLKDSYVTRQNLRCRYCGQSVQPSWRWINSPQHGECRHTSLPAGESNEQSGISILREPLRGQDFIRISMKGEDGRSAGWPGMELLAWFSELPRGSRARAVITATATAIVIGLAGYLDSKGQLPQASAVPALFLATPVAAASWFGLQRSAASVPGSLLARAALGASGLLALLSILLFMAKPAMQPLSDFTPIDSVLGIRDANWAGVFLLACGNAVVAAHGFLLNVARYNALLKRRT
ncbi:hypothetical protein AB0E12_03645 [Micromonospora chersina]|uniref:hypothetical protein n=1 Tax=Micromonospora chersina TaxID=47854 RepID=UPI0033CD3AA5